MKSQVENASVESVGQGTNKLKHLLKYYGVFAIPKQSVFWFTKMLRSVPYLIGEVSVADSVFNIKVISNFRFLISECSGKVALKS